MEISNRRDFLKNAAIGGTAAGAGFAAMGISSQRVSSQETSGQHELRFRNLGSTGYKVTEIGFGAMNMRDPELVHAVIDSGINYIDTAHSYMGGVNEEIIGTVMKTKRDKVFLTTKIRSRNPDEIPAMIETSLKRLQTDHVDLLLLHSVRGMEQILNDDFIKFFDDARRKGYTRFVGYSTHNFQGDIVDATLKSNFWEAVLLVYNYLSPPEVAASIEKAHEAGIGIIVMKSLLKMQSSPPRRQPDDRSQSSRMQPPPSRERPDEGERPRGRQRPRQEQIEDIREDKTSTTTPQQALLKWVLNNPNVDIIVPGMTSFEQLTDDLGVMGMKLSSDDRQILRRYSENIKGHYCCGVSGCTGCKDKCPRGVEINEINRCLGYAYGYGDIELARENYWNLPDSNRIDICADCTECAVKCVNGLNLTENIQRARELFV